MKKTACLLFICLSVMSFADGGGGFFFGMQASQYPLLENYPVNNNSMGLSCFGGYGYGITRHVIAGGFGYAFLDLNDTSGIAGGLGGIISGARILRWPISLSIVSWTGVGGISTGSYETAAGSGFFCISEELTVGLGIPLLRWFMPVVYAGYQVVGNLIPGQIFQAFFSYTPVVGIRLSWGEFF